MSSNTLFDSTTKPIPPVRWDLEIIPVQENGSSYLYFYDSRGYATQNFALDQQAARVLNLLDGHKSIEDLSPYLGKEVSKNQLLDYIKFLDKHRLLHSSYFKEYAEQVEQEYEAADVHEAVTAGLSYPADPDELTEYLDEAFQDADPSSTKHSHPVRALYAPHIDPRVGMESYVKAFQSIRHIKPERVVILATSHYAGMYPKKYQNKPFIISDKDFRMPLGTIKSDEKTIQKLLKNADKTGLTKDDRAHRIEHSIELHLLFLSYLWDHDYKIVPIVVNGFDELLYMQDGHQGKQIEAFSKQLSKHFADDKDTFFLISGDLAHIGKKFGDTEPARKLFEEVKQFDKQFLDSAEQGSQEKMLGLIKEKLDPYRICGFPPLYTFLKTMPELKGKNISYHLWDEQERESAVSFGSVLYFKDEL
ncbi:MAG: AmmeMemoRadiSam system protein B [Balneolaceae bacterium]|nr:AmmeMemoRadiSam system protein B [Balneolaceae bacterium]